MTGTYTTAASTTGNPYMIAGGVALDLYTATQQKAALERYNKQVRDFEVIKLALENTQANQQQAHLEDLAADEKFSLQIQQLKRIDRVQTSSGENGVRGPGIQRVVGALLSEGNRALGMVDNNLESSRTALALGKKTRQRNISMLIDNLEQYDESNFLRPLYMAGFGTIGGMLAESKMKEKKNAKNNG